MRTQISGKQLDIGEALQSHVKSELGETFEKYQQRPTDATVVFSKNAYEYSCEASVHLSTGLTAAASGYPSDGIDMPATIRAARPHGIPDGPRPRGSRQRMPCSVVAGRHRLRGVAR